MKKSKGITIYDIAKKLNLAASTVSRGLQDSPEIGKKTKKRIVETAEKMGYSANLTARSLRQQQSETIGVIVHQLNSNFVNSVLAGIERVTTEAGYDILIAHSSESYVKEVANAKNLFHRRVDGVISSLSLETMDLEHFRAFAERNVPVVYFDRVEQEENSTAVVIDNVKCGYVATQHLIQQGCKRIVHVTASLNRNVYSQRYEGYRKALAEHKLEFSDDLLIIDDHSERAAMDAAMKILQMNPRPDGVFVTSDFVAAFCMRTLRQHGISIPDTIAFVGFNNDPICKLIEPTLTTIDYPGKDIGEIAARNLISHLKGLSNINRTNNITVRSDLIVRESSVRSRDPE
ncbi:MAG: LacI family DNA-binding transcriptional regulator [Bacteroidota bacterium]|nr:LacI family DNA-binding transcriptional regulator [Bacteroidota bacterium]